MLIVAVPRAPFLRWVAARLFLGGILRGCAMRLLRLGVIPPFLLMLLLPLGGALLLVPRVPRGSALLRMSPLILCRVAVMRGLQLSASAVFVRTSWSLQGEFPPLDVNIAPWCSCMPAGIMLLLSGATIASDIMVDVDALGPFGLCLS